MSQWIPGVPVPEAHCAGILKAVVQRHVTNTRPGQPNPRLAYFENTIGNKNPQLLQSLYNTYKTLLYVMFNENTTYNVNQNSIVEQAAVTAYEYGLAQFILADSAYPNLLGPQAVQTAKDNVSKIEEILKRKDTIGQQANNQRMNDLMRLTSGTAAPAIPSLASTLQSGWGHIESTSDLSQSNTGHPVTINPSKIGPLGPMDINGVDWRSPRPYDRFMEDGDLYVAAHLVKSPRGLLTDRSYLTLIDPLRSIRYMVQSIGADGRVTVKDRIVERGPMNDYLAIELNPSIPSLLEAELASEGMCSRPGVAPVSNRKIVAVKERPVLKTNPVIEMAKEYADIIPVSDMIDLDSKMRVARIKDGRQDALVIGVGMHVTSIPTISDTAVLDEFVQACTVAPTIQAFANILDAYRDRIDPAIWSVVSRRSSDLLARVLSKSHGFPGTKLSADFPVAYADIVAALGDYAGYSWANELISSINYLRISMTLFFVRVVEEDEVKVTYFDVHDYITAISLPYTSVEIGLQDVNDSEPKLVGPESNMASILQNPINVVFNRTYCNKNLAARNGLCLLTTSDGKFYEIAPATVNADVDPSASIGSGGTQIGISLV